jgi:hypothetical protein
MRPSYSARFRSFVRPREYLEVRLCGSYRVNECLKHRDSVFRPIAVLPESCEGETVRGAISERELTISLKVVVLRILKAAAR